MIEAVVFDLWGTLAYTNGPSLTKTVQDLKIVDLSGQVIDQRIGKALMLCSVENVKEGLKYLCQLLKVKPQRKSLNILEADWREAAELARPYPGTIPLLSNLKRQYKTGLVSNCSSFSYGKLMSNYDLEKFFDVQALSFKVSPTISHRGSKIVPSAQPRLCAQSGVTYHPTRSPKDFSFPKAGKLGNFC